MNRLEWMRNLREELDAAGVPKSSEIVADYEEHFAVAAERGEHEQNVILRLGPPAAVARAHHAEAMITKVEAGSEWDFSNALGAALRLLVLTPFNFFMLIGPFLILCILLVVGWMLCLVGGALSVGAIALALFSLPFLIFSFWGTGAVFFGALAFVGLTVLSVLAMFWISKALVRVFVSYLRWNIDFVIDRKG